MQTTLRTLHEPQILTVRLDNHPKIYAEKVEKQPHVGAVSLTAVANTACRRIIYITMYY